MATATPPLGPAGGPGTTPATASDGDWPAQAADTIERLVGNVRDKTTGPALTVARAVVYGTFAVVVGTALVILAIVGAVRLLNNYLPDAWVGDDHMWVSYLIIGLVLLVAGIICWSRRNVAPGR
jgi:hypothetical protein